MMIDDDDDDDDDGGGGYDNDHYIQLTKLGQNLDQTKMYKRCRRNCKIKPVATDSIRSCIV